MRANILTRVMCGVWLGLASSGSLRAVAEVVGWLCVCAGEGAGSAPALLVNIHVRASQDRYPPAVSNTHGPFVAGELRACCRLEPERSCPRSGCATIALCSIVLVESGTTAGGTEALGGGFRPPAMVFSSHSTLQAQACPPRRRRRRRTQWDQRGLRWLARHPIAAVGLEGTISPHPGVACSPVPHDLPQYKSSGACLYFGQGDL